MEKAGMHVRLFFKENTTGKKVEMDYMVSPKGIASVEIVGENIVLCRDDTKGELRILVGFGILAVIRMKIRWHLKKAEKTTDEIRKA